VGVNPATFATWATGYTHPRPGRRTVKGAPIVTSLPTQRRGQAAVPFVGSSEALVLAAVRNSGVPLQRLRPALEVLSKDLGIEHALASRRLYSSPGRVQVPALLRSAELRSV
jgi:hypothetical protein